MGVLAKLLLGFGGLFGLVGFLTMFFPPLGLTLLVIGAGCFFLGRVMDRKARELAVRRQLGG